MSPEKGPHAHADGTHDVVEDYGLRRYVEFTPNPDQQFELRPFNFRMRRA